MNSSRVNGSARSPGLPTSDGKYGPVNDSTSPSGHVVTVTGSGRSTPSTRGAIQLRSSRTQNSSLPMSTTELTLATPMSSAKARMASGR